jgi:hypothetical protein
MRSEWGGAFPKAGATLIFNSSQVMASGNKGDHPIFQRFVLFAVGALFSSAS